MFIFLEEFSQQVIFFLSKLILQFVTTGLTFNFKFCLNYGYKIVIVKDQGIQLTHCLAMKKVILHIFKYTSPIIRSKLWLLEK